MTGRILANIIQVWDSFRLFLVVHTKIDIAHIIVRDSVANIVYVVVCPMKCINNGSIELYYKYERRYKMSNYYDVLDVSRYVINYSNEKGYGISNLKLQKILYFIQAFFLVNKDQPCFKDEIEAWDFGPVVRNVYKEYKRYGGSVIPTIKTYIECQDDDFWSSKVKNYDDTLINEDDKELIKDVVDAFRDFSASDLVRITHKQTPWKEAYAEKKNGKITIKAMREYFNGK